jgi:uncharacterized phage protein (TIGR01671 family)
MFRVWHKEGKLYIGNGLIDIRQGVFATQNLLDADKFLIEQCTGLKDKNGKLIYEGDIVEQNRRFYKVIFSYDDVASCGCCVGKFSGCGFVMEDKYGCRGDLDIYSELEIIGNIHENADLLENKDD